MLMKNKAWKEGTTHKVVQILESVKFNRCFYWSVNLYIWFRELKRDIATSQLLVDIGEGVNLKRKNQYWLQ